MFRAILMAVSLFPFCHDHLFAKQDLDGIVYQEAPQPGMPGNGNALRTAVEYGYVSGVIFGSPGCMRITVSPDKVTADLVYFCLPGNELANRDNRQVVYTCAIPDGTNQHVLPQ